MSDLVRALREENETLRKENEALKLDAIREMILLHARDDVETFLMEFKAMLSHCDMEHGEMGLCQCLRHLATWFAAHHLKKNGIPEEKA